MDVEVAGWLCTSPHRPCMPAFAGMTVVAEGSLLAFAGMTVIVS